MDSLRSRSGRIWVNRRHGIFDIDYTWLRAPWIGGYRMNLNNFINSQRTLIGIIWFTLGLILGLETLEFAGVVLFALGMTEIRPTE